jgi:hypothetical protein
VSRAWVKWAAVAVTLLVWLVVIGLLVIVMRFMSGAGAIFH